MIFLPHRRKAFQPTGGLTGFLLDDFNGSSDCHMAVSFRQLSSTFTGDICRLRRDSDSAELDFTLIELGDGTAQTWVGMGNEGYCRTIYDQTGNGNDWVQGGLALMIDSSNNFITVNGEYAYTFSTSAISVTALTSTDAEMYHVGLNSTADTTQSIMGGSNTYLPLGQSGSSSTEPYRGVGSPVMRKDASVQSITTRGDAYAAVVTNAQRLINFSILTSSALTSSGPWMSVGQFQECVLWDGERSTGDRSGIHDNINAHYAIY